jgi:decaprenyl-phosphate phosphoribosyltransferase
VPSTAIADARPSSAIWPYVQIARVDHWFKNAFMVLGVILAVFYDPGLLTWRSALTLGLAFFATCLVASSNYVLNELLDGPQDRFHPTKRHRPVPSGQVRPAIAYAEWLLLGAAGIGLGLVVNRYFAASALSLWVMGVAYNVRPLRTKEWPYLDVLSESVNNPIRLLLGWFALITTLFPPVSLILSYWMVGAFFMAMKRYAEYRHIGDPEVAATYRHSFRYYTDERLLISILFYATACALFAGIFIVRYHLELILFVPFAAGVFSYYMKLGLKPNSPTQNPEKLYRERGFMAYLLVSVAVFVVLMFVHIPPLYDLFNVEPMQTTPLWTIGTSSPPE